MSKLKNLISILLLINLVFTFPSFSQDKPNNNFKFSVTADTRMFAGENRNSVDFFKGVLLAMKKVGAGEFLISPGDIDPPQYIRQDLDKYLGKDFIWYPVVGNHELDSSAYISYLREYNKNGNTLPNIVNLGPKGTEETTYSFDFENTHFAVINQYYDGKCDDCLRGDISEPLYNWLKEDLHKTKKQHIFVVGHEPAFPQPDAYNFRMRHEYDCLNQHPENRDRFWKLLSDYKVTAYLCGHTHNFNIIKIDGVWQIDAGHARGAGDTGAPSTFLTIEVENNKIILRVYRDIHDGNYDYNDIIKTINLK